jgi:two-component system, chemotaxis family, protein-glutamate methylesterase/glutaminase
MITDNTNITCPDCRGALKRIQDGELLQYQCRVGHSYSPQSAVAAHADTEENALWAAVVALEEGADLQDEVIQLTGVDDGGDLIRNAQLKRQLAERVREVVRELRAPRLI